MSKASSQKKHFRGSKGVYAWKKSFLVKFWSTKILLSNPVGLQNDDKKLFHGILAPQNAMKNFLPEF